MVYYIQSFNVRYLKSVWGVDDVQKILQINIINPLEEIDYLILCEQDTNEKIKE